MVNHMPAKAIPDYLREFPTLKELIAFMHDQGIRHIELQGGFVVDLSPAPALPSASTSPIPAIVEERCSCAASRLDMCT
jgi:hypothetical protein